MFIIFLMLFNLFFITATFLLAIKAKKIIDCLAKVLSFEIQHESHKASNIRFRFLLPTLLVLLKSGHPQYSLDYCRGYESSIGLLRR